MLIRIPLFAVALGIAIPASAHTGHITTAGFMHPLSGLDHLLVMVSVGLWAALLGGRAVWLVPTAFLVSMVGGFAIAVAGIRLPAVEPGIAASVLIIGILVAAAVRLPLRASLGLVGLFAFFHGLAHGVEFVAADSAPVFRRAFGFITATALLHLTGVGLGQALHGSRHAMLVRSLGGAVAVCGALLLGGWT